MFGLIQGQFSKEKLLLCNVKNKVSCPLVQVFKGGGEKKNIDSRRERLVLKVVDSSCLCDKG